jgi:hypothetical protein
MLATTQAGTSGLPGVSGLRSTASAAANAIQEARAWPGPERAAVLAELDTVIAILTTARADLLVAQRDSGSWRGSGDASFEAWRGRTSRAGMRAAVTEVRRAEVLREMPAMRDAATSGGVSVEHVDVMAKVAAGASGPVREALASADGQEEVLGLARRLDANHFARSMATWTAALDADAHERSHQAQRAARFLHVVDTDSGIRVSGQLDRMAGHRLRLALEAAAGRPALDDTRLPEQRRADALDAIAEVILARPETARGSAVRPHVSFIMSAETWAGLRAHHVARTAARRARRTGRTPGHEAVLPGAAGSSPATTPIVPVTLEDGTPVPLSEVARALCDCELTRVVTTAASEPLDLGRRARLYTGGQRRAVIARDGGCAWPSCRRPARWCEVHHMRWWERDGGGTSVDNGVLLCSYHHHEVHRRDLTITRRPPGSDAPPELRGVRYQFTLPDGRAIAGDDGHMGAPAETTPAAVPGTAPPVSSSAVGHQSALPPCHLQPALVSV